MRPRTAKSERRIQLLGDDFQRRKRQSIGADTQPEDRHVGHERDGSPRADDARLHASQHHRGMSVGRNGDLSDAHKVVAVIQKRRVNYRRRRVGVGQSDPGGVAGRATDARGVRYLVLLLVPISPVRS